MNSLYIYKIYINYVFSIYDTGIIYIYICVCVCVCVCACVCIRTYLNLCIRTISSE